jgi:hypothetical protein
MINDLGPYFRKQQDSKLYTVYVSLDDRYKTVYNKKTYEIKYIKTRKSYRFKSDRDYNLKVNNEDKENKSEVVCLSEKQWAPSL